jgi:hypothetical protein
MNHTGFLPLKLFFGSLIPESLRGAALRWEEREAVDAVAATPQPGPPAPILKGECPFAEPDRYARDCDSQLSGQH